LFGYFLGLQCLFSYELGILHVLEPHAREIIELVLLKNTPETGFSLDRPQEVTELDFVKQQLQVKLFCLVGHIAFLERELCF